MKIRCSHLSLHLSLNLNFLLAWPTAQDAQKGRLLRPPFVWFLWSIWFVLLLNPEKQNKPNNRDRPNNDLRMPADFLSILLGPLSLTPLLAVHVCPYFMHHSLLVTIPCSLVPQILQVFHISIFQSLWARFESKQLVDGLSLL